MSTVFKVLEINGLATTFSTLCTALIIPVTLPVVGSTPEKTFWNLSQSKTNCKVSWLKKG